MRTFTCRSTFLYGFRTYLLDSRMILLLACWPALWLISCHLVEIISIFWICVLLPPRDLSDSFFGQLSYLSPGKLSNLVCFLICLLATVPDWSFLRSAFWFDCRLPVWSFFRSAFWFIGYLFDHDLILSSVWLLICLLAICLILLKCAILSSLLSFNFCLLSLRSIGPLSWSSLLSSFFSICL